MPWKSYRKESRTDWGRDLDGHLDRESLQFGAILRIADAVEKMAQSYDALIHDRDFYKRRSKELTDYSIQQSHRIRSLRGVITRMKK